MGTNFYWIKIPKELEKYKTKENKSILEHIGKRSGAGKYCKKCGTTFHRFGTNYIHSEFNAYMDLEKLRTEEGRNRFREEQRQYWYDKCPICGGEGEYICTFTWSLMKHKWICEKLKDNKEQLIKDEYDRKYTVEEFLDQISTPVEYQVGSDFS